ncbi:MAG: YajQ family cyclic di-GMP-binding protein [Candidatus Omnitrophica bacterium]|nr:YajQ family cyclic di-GMP-binding protein [Candidatus Omnitrophota bacterium]
MADQFSFDIVSQIDLQEIDNAVNQAIKELRTRFDFKGSKSSIEFLKTDKKIRLIGDDDLKLKNLQEMLKTRMASRKVPLKALQFGEPEQAFEGTLRQEVMLIQGIPQDKAKEIVRMIKEAQFKAQAAIQGDQIRVSSKSKDALQEVISYVRTLSVDIPLQFTNYR